MVTNATKRKTKAKPSKRRKLALETHDLVELWEAGERTARRFEQISVQLSSLFSQVTDIVGELGRLRLDKRHLAILSFKPVGTTEEVQPIVLHKPGERIRIGFTCYTDAEFELHIENLTANHVFITSVQMAGLNLAQGTLIKYTGTTVKNCILSVQVGNAPFDVGGAEVTI